MKKYKNTEFLAEEWRERLKIIKGLCAYSDREAGCADGEAMAYAAVLDDLEHAPEVDEETIYRRVKRRYLKEDIEALGAHFRNYRMIERVEILPYHTLGVHKYEAMQMEYKLNDVKPNTPQQLEEARQLFGRYFKTVFVN